MDTGLGSSYVTFSTGTSWFDYQSAEIELNTSTFGMGVNLQDPRGGMRAGGGVLVSRIASRTSDPENAWPLPVKHSTRFGIFVEVGASTAQTSTLMLDAGIQGRLIGTLEVPALYDRDYSGNPSQVTNPVRLSLRQVVICVTTGFRM